MLKLFAPAHVKATQSPIAQALVSAGEIIVLAAIPSILVAVTEYITNVTVFNLRDFATFAGITVLLALLKATATYVTAKGSPTSALWGAELMAFEAALAQRLRVPAVLPQAPISPPTTATSGYVQVTSSTATGAIIGSTNEPGINVPANTIPQSLLTFSPDITMPLAAIQTAQQVSKEA